MIAYQRPERHAAAVSGASTLPAYARRLLVTRVYADLAAWLFAAPFCVLAAASLWCVAPVWQVLFVAGAVLWGPVLLCSSCGCARPWLRP